MKLKHFLAVILILFYSTGYSQRQLRTDSKKAIKNYEAGLQAYNLQEYALATSYLKAAIEADKNFQNAYMVLAEVYWDSQQLEEAINYYKMGIALDPSFYPRAYLNEAKLEVRIGRYADARENYKSFLEYEPEGSKYFLQAKRGIEQTSFALEAMANPVEFNPLNIGANVNTKDNEYWPSLSADGQTLVITRMVSSYDVTIGNYQQEDFYYSKLEDTTWSTARSVGSPLNTRDNEGAQSISADGRFMVYTVCNRRGVIGRCDIYYSKLENGKWTEPANMGAPLNSKAKETQPSINADGTIVYFSSNRPGGKGGLDLWMSELTDDGSWSVPINLGDTINTPADEMSPFIHKDGKTLYFSSNGHLGMGGFDLFRSERTEGGKWTSPMNLGYPINTHGDEVGMIVNAKGNVAYYSSDRNKQQGKDIYKFELYKEARPQEVSYLKGTVYDEQTHRRLKARFELYDLENGNLISRSESDEQTGEFLICIPTNKDYMLNINRTNYLFYSDNFSLRGIFHLNEPFLKDIPLKPIQAGQSVILRNIFFETDAYALKDESKYELDKIVRFLETNPSVNIEISGHTDNQGTEQYNRELSANRAGSVVDYLVQNGVSRNRLVAVGHGFSKPIDSNESAEGRAKNRRTELKIIE